jgi:hypothetical protein
MDVDKLFEEAEKKVSYRNHKATNACLEKYFGGTGMARNVAANVLKSLLCATMNDIQELKKSRKLPACLSLLVDAIFRDIDAGRFDAFSGIIDSVF